MNIQNAQPKERRRQSRTAINRLASLSYPPLGLLQTRISDISDSGIFLHLGSIRLNLYSNAEIIECIDNTLNLVRAQIVRISERGAGLHFIDPDPLLIERLRSGYTVLSPTNDET